MEIRHRKVPVKRFNFFPFAVMMVAATFAIADTIKLSDVPLSQVIELFSKETRKDVFVDDSLQQQKRVTAHLQNMPVKDAFTLLQKTLGIEEERIGTSAVVLFPSERAARYRSQFKSRVFRLPAGVDAKWAISVFGTMLPGARASPFGNNDQSILIVGPSSAIDDARALIESLPSLAQSRRVAVMPENEAKLAVKELDSPDLKLEVGPNGLNWLGTTKAVSEFVPRLRSWQQQTRWGSEVYNAENMDPAKSFKVADAAKGRAIVSDLGGTGATLIEGPALDRQRLITILESLEDKNELVQREVELGDISPQSAKEALRSANIVVQGAGDRRLVLVGREKAVVNAAKLVSMLGRKRHQVGICFRLAEVARSRLKTLGIDLDATTYSYGQIKQFHPQDNLPLLLKALHEDNDSHILAQPNLRVLEKEEAKVLIGDRIPLEVAATAQTDSGSVLKLNTQLTWVDVGIKLTAKSVQVGPDGDISMALSTEVSTVVSTTKQGYPQIRTREANSSLRISDGGTVVMGGLISREERETGSKIPLIGDIPLFGGLARGRDRSGKDTEIIMLVTAKILDE
ncbi:MAG: hypothetical protein C0411_21110 [Pseudomonas sp.]|nr:hypothetical protein [Pseudomonas sp.]